MRRSKLIGCGSVLTAVLAGAGGAIWAPAGAVAASKHLKISAAADTYVSSARRNSTFGTQDKLAIGRVGREVKTSFLKFSVPAGTRVSAARLVLTTIGAPGGAITVRRVLNNSWSPATLTAGTAPALGPAVATATAKAANTTLAFDLRAAVSRAGTYSFALTGGGPVLRVRSTEAGYGAPHLDVTTEGDTSPPVAAAPPSTQDCVTGALLVPSCGVLWGGAAGGFTSAPRDVAQLDWEKASGRTATIFHTYHKGDEIFPTKAEVAMTADSAHPRVLLLNWKVAYGSTWAGVAQGRLDRRIDTFARRAKAYGKKFFLVLNHEPENDVIARAGSGMQAKDFAAMYRHTILRLRADGVSNVVNVVAYMGNERWLAQSWWKDLYPGDDVVDWIGLDSYVSVDPGYHFGLFADLLDRKAPKGPTIYDWATKMHPSKPLMVAEWGAYHRVGRPVDKSAVYNSVLPELAERPAIKAIVHFDTKHDATGDRDISIDSTSSSLAAFRQLASAPIFTVRLG